MPAALKIALTSEENKTLQELELSQKVPKRTKQRATAFRLNAKGLKVKAITKYLGWAESTVRQTIHRWNKSGLTGLWEAKGRGKKAIWKETDWEAVEKWLSEQRSYSARQLSQKLAQEKQIKLGAEQVRRILVKKNGVGKD